MKQKDRGKENRGPWNIKGGHQNGRCYEPLHRFQIGQTGVGFDIWCHSRFAYHGIKNAPVQSGLKTRPNTGHDPTARMIENAHCTIKEHHQNRQRDQRLF